MYKKYQIGEEVIYTNPVLLNRDFVSWKNVWMFVQVLIAILALEWTFSQPGTLKILVVALVGTWLIWTFNQI